MQGIRLEGKKDATTLVWTLKRFDPPPKVCIPINGAPLVRVGDKVKTGQKIAEPTDSQSVSVHASLSGNITAIDIFPHPFLGRSQAIEIESDKQDQKIPGFGTERPAWQRLGPEELLTLFQDSGLVDLDLETTPVHLKALPAPKLILNACEPEPYLTCEHALMMSHPLEILKGAEILRKAAGAEEVVIVTQDDKREAAEILKSKIYFLKWPHVQVQMTPSIYPAQFEAFNIATAFAVYEAVVLQKPFIERAVTVGGECLIEPKNVWARMGTDFETLIKYARGFLRQPGKVLAGGPMTGAAQNSLAAAVTPGLPGLLALPEELVKPEQVEPCIRCGLCAAACPVDISPAMITLAAEQDLFELAKDYGAEACIECGNCTYVCPSKRPMLELVQYALNSQ